MGVTWVLSWGDMELLSGDVGFPLWGTMGLSHGGEIGLLQLLDALREKTSPKKDFSLHTGSKLEPAASALLWTLL